MYSHTQRGTVLLFSLGAAVLLQAGILAFGNVAPGDVWVLRATMVLLLVLMASFSSMTITVDDTHVRWHFGPGFWKKRMALDEIESHRPVDLHWFKGWGIRFIGRGWLYNVSGRRAVEIRTQTGKVVQLGTDEPEALDATLSESLAMP